MVAILFVWTLVLLFLRTWCKMKRMFTHWRSSGDWDPSRKNHQFRIHKMLLNLTDTRWILRSMVLFNTVKLLLTATPLQWPLFLSRRTKTPYIDSCLNLSIMATSLQWPLNLLSPRWPLYRGSTVSSLAIQCTYLPLEKHRTYTSI